jgi:hypothetical protein
MLLNLVFDPQAAAIKVNFENFLANQVPEAHLRFHALL